MTKSDLLHVLNALDAAEAEFESLETTKDWYSTTGEVVEQLVSAREIIVTEINNL